MEKKKRLFIEVDSLEVNLIDSCATDAIHRHGGTTEEEIAESDTFFDWVIADALSKHEDVAQAVKDADEIYASTSLIPRYGSGDFGAPMLFKSLMYKAVTDNITGKDVYIMREYRYVHWDNLSGKGAADLFRKAFANNRLFVEGADEGWVQVDIEKLIAEEL